MAYESLSEKEEYLAKGIFESAYAVHRHLGPGLLESIYEVCFCHELGRRKITYQRQVVIPLVYDEVQFEEGFRIDVLVGNLIVCELKAVEVMNPVFKAQLLTYLKLTGKRLGFLINFNVPLIKDGINRFIL